jgi:hypothetical protein
MFYSSKSENAVNNKENIPWDPEIMQLRIDVPRSRYRSVYIA